MYQLLTKLTPPGVRSSGLWAVSACKCQDRLVASGNIPETRDLAGFGDGLCRCIL
jgi:hypothetical protein